ncbi:MAG: hypothetical protein ACRDS9_20650 [Pseudonocardiaceae bacterium]
MVAPDGMPKFIDWSRSFVPPAGALDYLSQQLSVTDVVLLLNLITPPLIEVEGCVLFKDRYFPNTFADWAAHLDHSPQALERVTNQVNLWDVFEPTDATEEEALNSVATTLTHIWPEHARRSFPDMTFKSEITDSYGPGVTLFRA